MQSDLDTWGTQHPQGWEEVLEKCPMGAVGAIHLCAPLTYEKGGCVGLRK